MIDKYIHILLIGIIIATVVLSVIFSFVDEISNNITLIVEVGVGITIAIIVYRTTKKSEKQNLDTLDKVQEILIRQQYTNSERKKRLYEKFCYNLQFWKNRLNLISDYCKEDPESVKRQLLHFLKEFPRNISYFQKEFELERELLTDEYN